MVRAIPMMPAVAIGWVWNHWYRVIPSSSTTVLHPGTGKVMSEMTTVKATRPRLSHNQKRGKNSWSRRPSHRSRRVMEVNSTNCRARIPESTESEKVPDTRITAVTKSSAAAFVSRALRG